MKKAKTDISTHALVPKHVKLSDKEKTAVLGRYHASADDFPKILKKDPAIASLNVSQGDMIKITRKSPTADQTVFYRVVGLS